jgi:hypothetical protein
VLNVRYSAADEHSAEHILCPSERLRPSERCDDRHVELAVVADVSLQLCVDREVLALEQAAEVRLDRVALAAEREERREREREEREEREREEREERREREKREKRERERRERREKREREERREKREKSSRMSPLRRHRDPP